MSTEAETARIAQNAFHLHQTSSRWNDLHSADQAAYVDFTRWVLEVLERDSQVIEAQSPAVAGFAIGCLLFGRRG